MLLRKCLGHALAIVQAHTCHRHQKLHRYVSGDAAFTNLLLNAFGKQLDQRQAARNPTHTAIEAARQFVKSEVEVLFEFRQQPALL